MSLEQKLGRRYVRDEQDDRYPVRSLISTPRATDRTYRHWYVNARRDQIGSTCFPAGTRVTLANGSTRPIEALNVLDDVVTAERNVGRITRIGARLHTDGLIRLRLEGHSHLRLTPEHPILTARGYVAASELKVGTDYVALPRVVPATETREVELVTGPRRRWTRVQAFGADGRGTVAVALPTAVALDERFGRLFGLYLAEGSIKSRGGITWTVGAHEDHLVENIQNLIADIFGLHARVLYRRDAGSVNITVTSAGLADLFEALGGRGSASKRLSPEVTSGPIEFREALLWGWADGDGHRRTGLVDAVTVSPQLALDMFNIANSLGLLPAIRRGESKQTGGGVRSRQPRWDVIFHDPTMPDGPRGRGSGNWRRHQDETHMWRRVRALEHEDFAGYVFNLEVEGDNSYVAEGIGVHNCVANAMHDLLAASPNPIRPTTLERAWGQVSNDEFRGGEYRSQQSGERGFRGNLYDQAQQTDEWPETPPEDGTSIRAAMKTLQAWGLVQNYYWATSVDEIAQAILTVGPVAWGSAWYSNQFGTPRGDRVYLEPTGRIVGGHAIALTGTNLRDEVFRVSTWGATYWLTYDAAAFLLDLGDAEAAVYVEAGA